MCTDNKYIKHACQPPKHIHQCKGQRDKESHNDLHTGTPRPPPHPTHKARFTRHPPADSLHTAFTGVTLGVQTRGDPSDKKANAPVWVSRPMLPPHKGQDPQWLSLKRGLSNASCRLQGKLRFQCAGAFLWADWVFGPERPNHSVLRVGRARVRAEGGRLAARSRSPPCRPPISPFLAEAPPAPNGKAPLPAQRCAADGGTGSASPPPRRQPRPRGRRPARGARPVGGGPPSPSRPGPAHCGLPPGEGQPWA